MTDQVKPADECANVLPLRVSEEIARQTARDIEILFPGWRVWFEAKAGHWHVRRAGTFSQGPGDERVAAVSASDVLGLVAKMERQVRLDLAIEFPEWEITQSETDGWQAVHEGGPPGQHGRAVVRVVRHPTIAGLHAALRELATREAGQ